MFLLLTHSSTLLFTLLLLTSLPCILSRTLTFSPVTKISLTNHNIQRLADAGKGSTITGISEIKKYFSHFGYINISLHNNSTFSDIFDAEFESVLNLYQQKLGLQVTGKLDSNTLSHITTPRCGVPDTINVDSFHSTEHYLYFPGKPRWTRPMPMSLTYSFSRDYMIRSLSLHEIREAFKRAFSRWASVIPVSFVETDDYSFADIKIGFYNGDHGDGEPFDGVLGVLAHSFSPESGRLHLDAAETWAVDFGSEKSDVAVDLESVATHEIGHLLGLSHSSVKEAVMYPSLKARDKRADLKMDDIKGVQALYGSNPNFRFGSSLESDISTNGADLRVRSLRLAGIILFSFIQSLCLCI
ncbi:hypothetical protein L6164_003610 [Bauhinia variegata]|uniref:Uncharacterized protein n=1 Tax=Bauhinia variegata TaxID=167791 RepID=A0ACB9Q1U6_BAUVA|nr:hypothetical protein L6164_003610 [Bauhinia variegata]